MRAPAARGACSCRWSSAAAEPPRGSSPDLPVVVRDGSAARQRFEAAFDTIRQVFPPSLCYTKIVPVDEVITLTLFYREDDHLRRLMLDQAQAAELDRLWAELRFVSQDALTLVDAFQQLLEYASQDADPRVFEPMRKPINDRAAAFRRELVAAEPRPSGRGRSRWRTVRFAARSPPPRRASSASFIASCAARRSPMTRRSGWCWPACWSRRRFCTGSRSRRRARKRRRSPTGSWRAG